MNLGCRTNIIGSQSIAIPDNPRHPVGIHHSNCIMFNCVADVVGNGFSIAVRQTDKSKTESSLFGTTYKLTSTNCIRAIPFRNPGMHNRRHTPILLCNSCGNTCKFTDMPYCCNNAIWAVTYCWFVCETVWTSHFDQCHVWVSDINTSRA